MNENRTIDGGHLAPHPGMTDEELQDFERDMNVPNPTFPPGASPPPPNLSARWTMLRLVREFEDITLRPRLSSDPLNDGALPPHVEISPHKGSRWYTAAGGFVIWISLLAWSPWWANAQFLVSVWARSWYCGGSPGAGGKRAGGGSSSHGASSGW